MDGFPRTLLQAEMLDTALGFYHLYPLKVILLELNEAKAVERLVKRGREDDTETAIRERLRWYREEVEPIIDYYRKKPGHVVITINADQSVEAVHGDIRKELKLS